MATWNSRGLRGSVLEELINYANQKYKDKGLALIQKIPTPITPGQYGLGNYRNPSKDGLHKTRKHLHI